MEPIILLNNGKYFDYRDPVRSCAESITPEVVAGALANIARFTGQTDVILVSPPTVAQHCVFVSQIIPAEFAREGLLHDAHECVMNDLASPIKTLLPDYRRLERVVECAFRIHFGLPIGYVGGMHPRVKQADWEALQAEKRVVFARDDHPEAWGPDVSYGLEYGRIWSHQEAHERWLARYYELTPNT